MNRKRTRLSLSRRKKTKISEVEDMNSELCGRDGNSEIVVFPPDENPVIESKQNHAKAKDSQSNKKIKSLGKTKETTGVNCMDNNNGNPANKRIATWFLKPCSPKSVSCPLCGKLAILSKINQHLDSNCKLHLALVIAEDCTANELAGAHSCSPCSSDYSAKEVLKPSYQNADRKENRSECYKPCVKSPESRDENLALEGVSSILKPANERKDFILLKKMTRKMDSKKQSPFAMDEESCIESSSDCDQGTACQEPCDTFATLSREGKSIHNDGNDPNEVQASKINLTEDVSENSKEKDDKDHEPYYLANFKLVVNNVLSNKDDRQLFNEEDNGIIDAFNVMSSEEQKLYIRLFQRKHGWFRCSKLEYLRISNNLTPILKSLAEKG